MNCPHCGQLMNVYRRSLRKGLVEALIKLSKAGPSKSADLGIPLGINGDFSKMRFWGLIYKPSEDRSIWAITTKGILFINGKVSIPKYIYIYNNNVESYSTEQVFVDDITHEKVSKESALKNSTPKNQIMEKEVEWQN